MAIEGRVDLSPIIDTTPGTCTECGFDSLVRVRLYNLHSQGVSLAGDVIVCGRCADQDPASPQG